jgi:lycopene cyclase domain-containing protein
VSYSQLAVLGVVAAVLVDTVLLRTWLLRRKTYWTAYAIVLFFQLITNGVFTGLDIVRYDPGAILGPRIAFAPVEDLLFGFAMVTGTLSTWVWLGRRGVRQGRRAAYARARPGTATASRRGTPTETRRSSTR